MSIFRQLSFSISGSDDGAQKIRSQSIVKRSNQSPKQTNLATHGDGLLDEVQTYTVELPETAKGLSLFGS
jgi:hypothetical protein